MKALLARLVKTAQSVAVKFRAAWRYLRWALAGFAVIAAALAGRESVRWIRAQLGKVGPLGGDRFEPDPKDPTKLWVWPSTTPGPIQVILPPDIKGPKVKAVQVIAGGKATVELLP